MADGKLYLSDAGSVMWVPSDPDNYEYKLAQAGWYPEVDPATGAPFPGEVERAAAVRAAAFEGEADMDATVETQSAVPEDDPEAAHRLDEQMAGRPLF